MPGRGSAEERGRAEPLPKHGIKRPRDGLSPSPDQPHDKSDAQQPKRSRVTRACDQCRAIRERCDGIKPICGTCVAQDRTCTWKEPPKKRGIQPNYIRTLELTLAWVFQKVPGAEETLAASLPDVDGPAVKEIGGKNTSASEALHQTWRNGPVCKQIDQLLSGQVVEHASSIDPLWKPLRRNEAIGCGDITMDAPVLSETYQPASDVSHSGHDTQHSFLSPSSKPQDSAMLRLPANAWTLVEYYFAFTHNFMPFIGKQDIMKLMYTFPAGGLSFQQAILQPEYAELWAIFTLAATQIPDHSDPHRAGKLREIATRLFPLDQKSLGLAHVNAFLLFTMMDMLKSSILGAYLALGSALRLLAYPHPINKASVSPLWDRYKRSRLAASILEVALTGRLQTSPQNVVEQLNESSLVGEDGDEEWSPFQDPLFENGGASGKSPARACSTFNSLIRLLIESRLMVGAKSVQATTSFSELVFSLISNSAQPHGRQPPAEMVVSHILSRASSHLPAQVQTLRSHPIPVKPRAYSHDGHTRSDPTHRSPAHKTHASISIPHDATAMTDTNEVEIDRERQKLFGWSADKATEVERPTNGSVRANDLEDDAQEHEIAPTGTLFEELAMLEGAGDAAHDQQFMRNLGFGPELDLAEFFGPDYQPSDPLLAYMQPSLYGARPGDEMNG